jgi:hypothetical protein
LARYRNAYTENNVKDNIYKGVKSANGLTGEVYTHLKIVFGENPKTILPEYNCNQDLVF